MAGNTSVRYAIYNAVYTALTAITTGNGYWTSPSVLLFEPPDPDDPGGPWLVLSIGQETMDNVSAGRRYTHTMEIVVDCYVQKVASRNAIQELCKITQDVRRAVSTLSSTIGGTVSAATHMVIGDANQHEGVLGHIEKHVHASESIMVTYLTRDAW
ncbi:MAG: hypothetical protein H8E44_28470 [Planctomycetes bacterium]|nr:hypothetical protein [Planctomycetota bacterium]